VTPFANFTFFGLLLYVCWPAVALALGLGLAVRWRRPWILGATLVMLAATYGADLQWLALYAVGQFLLARGLLWLKLRSRARWAIVPALLLSLSPLVLQRWWGGGSTAPERLSLSYATFRSLDVLLGIQDGALAALPAGRFAAYLLFFPALSAGPIDRYRRFGEDWQAEPTQADSLADLDAGIHRIFGGLLYKFLLAALVRTYWLKPLAKHAALWPTVGYAYAYSLFLFFDFAGYSALAIGVGRLFGVRSPENFDRPFLAQGIRDFWNRWHISLSSWLRDHVYMRFLLAARRRRWFRGRHTASHLGLLMTMGLMGLWHGTEWRYLVYGLYHGGLLVCSDVLGRRGLWGEGPLWRAASVVITFHAVCLGFLIFSGRLF
jgi:membrane protein involved in D-alanine export